MDYNEEIIKELQEMKELLRKLLVVFEKYDDEFKQSEEYLAEVKKDGLGHPNG